jgi:cyanate lyase
MLKAKFFARSFSSVPFFPLVVQDPRWNFSGQSQWSPSWVQCYPQWSSPLMSQMSQEMGSFPVPTRKMGSFPLLPETMQDMHGQISQMYYQMNQFQDQQRQILEELRQDTDIGTRDRDHDRYIATRDRDHDRSSFTGRAPYAPTWAPFFQSDFMGPLNTVEGLPSHHLPTPLTRASVIQILMNAKRESKRTFKEIAKQVGRSEVWTTSAILGQQAFSEDEAERLLQVLGIHQHETAKQLKLILTEPPMRGAFNGRVPVDPTIYRLYEILQVYGTTLKALTHEKVGDGIMSAVNLEINLDKTVKQDGDYVQLTLTGEFEPFKKW